MGEFRMPSLGADMDEGTLVEWLVAPGDAVHRGDIVAVVDTAKSAIEIEVFEDGVVEELLVPTGTTVPVGTAIARLGGARRHPPTTRKMKEAMASPAHTIWTSAASLRVASTDRPPPGAREGRRPVARPRQRPGRHRDPRRRRGSGRTGRRTVAAPTPHNVEVHRPHGAGERHTFGGGGTRARVAVRAGGGRPSSVSTSAR